MCVRFFSIRVCGSIVTQTHKPVRVYLFISFVPSFYIHILYVCYVEMDKHAYNKYIYICTAIYHFPVDEQVRRRWLIFPYTFFPPLLRRIYMFVHVFTRAKVSESENPEKQQAKKRERSREKKKNKPLNPSHRDFIWNTNHMVCLCCAELCAVYAVCARLFHRNQILYAVNASTFCAIKYCWCFLIYLFKIL